MPFIDRALRGSWSSIANDSSGVLRFVANLGSKETATRNSSQQQPNNNQQQLTTTNQNKNKNKNRNKNKKKDKNKNNKQPQREQELEAKTAATVQEHNLRMSKQDASWEQKKQNMMQVVPDGDGGLPQLQYEDMDILFRTRRAFICYHPMARGRYRRSSWRTKSTQSVHVEQSVMLRSCKRKRNQQKQTFV